MADEANNPEEVKKELKASKSLLRKGLIGTAIAAICCFTPALVILFGLVGVTAWLSWADWVLFPMLGLSILVVIYALYKHNRCKKCLKPENLAQEQNIG